MLNKTSMESLTKLFLGVFDTPLLAVLLKKKTNDTLTKTVVFLQRLGKPDEFALMCLTIVENSYLSG